MEIVQSPPKFSPVLQYLSKENACPDSVFIFWKKVAPGEPSAVNLITAVNAAIKASNRLMIYDVDRVMNEEEVAWILKNGGELYEPYLQTRRGFVYLPEPVELKMPGLDIPKKEFFFGYYNKFPNRIICEELDIDPVLRDDFNYSYAIALDTNDDCMYGRIHMELIQGAMVGVKPLIPGAHRWFHGLISEVGSPLLVPRDIGWYKKTSGEYYGYCHGFLETVERQYPEFKFNHFKDVLNG